MSEAAAAMNPKALCGLAARLMRHPAAPYHEYSVREEVEKICREHGLEFHLDRFGNGIARLRQAKCKPLVLAAHMDHPAFEMTRSLGPDRWVAEFRGGVGEAYFRPGIRLRIMPGAIPAQLGQRLANSKSFEVTLKKPASEPAAFAVWEMEDFLVRNGRIYGRACDDLIGVAAILGTMIELKRSDSQAHVLGVISRAEEVGFHGALAAAGGSTIPKNSLVISLETSRELPGVRMGEGVIIRVGDRTSIFDSEATRFLAEVAAELAGERKRFRFQRGLMSGGTCEATAYQEFGFKTAAVCVALGNYHNCGERTRIAPEYVNVADVCGMVELLVAAANRARQYQALVSKLPKRLVEMYRQAQRRLRQTARNGGA